MVPLEERCSWVNLRSSVRELRNSECCLSRRIRGHRQRSGSRYEWGQDMSRGLGILCRQGVFLLVLR